MHANCPHIKEVIDLCVAEYEESKHVKSDGGAGIGLEHIENPDDSDDDHAHQRRRPPCARRSVIGAPSRIAPVHRAYAGAYQALIKLKTNGL